jgi:hypothetical protein
MHFRWPAKFCDTLLLITALLISCSTIAFSQDCEPLKPQQTMKSDVSKDIKAGADELFKQLGSADYESKSDQTEQDLYK